MQLLSQENSTYELRVDSLEDLWILSQFITPDDKLFASTQRKIKIGNDKTKTATKIIHVELLVQKTSFEHETLRVSGTIQNETEFTAIGQAHTLSFGVNDSIKVLKTNMLNYEKKLLDKALKSKKSLNLLVLLDKDELVCAEFGDFSFRILFSKDNLGSKKYHQQEINDNEEKYLILEEFLKRDYSSIIFAGPGNFKDNLKKYITDKINLTILTLAWHDVSPESVQKVIKEITQSGLLESNQLSVENEFMNTFLKNIDKGEKVSYGEKNTVESINTGAVETLLITTKLIDKKRELEEYKELNETIKTCEQLNGTLVIINSRNEPGKILDGLGGIGAILRY